MSFDTRYLGTASARFNTTLLTHTAEEYVPKFTESFLTSTNLLKAFSLAAFGKPAILGNVDFGNVTSTTGKGIRFGESFQFSGPLATSGMTATYVDPLGNINPQLWDGMTGWAYVWKRFCIPMQIPVELVQDNQSKNQLLDLLKTNMTLGQAAAINTVLTGFLGSSSAPSNSPTGLCDLVDVTQTATVGAISPSTHATWKNVKVSCTTVGGGGELDRPLALLRKIQGMRVKVKSAASATQDRLYVGTPGAYQYVLRAAYADNIANAGLRNPDYDAAGITHIVIEGSPLIYDTYVTAPTGATASTEALFDLDLNSIGIAFHKKEYFKVQGWEEPRAHDRQQYVQGNLWARWTPWCSNRRDHAVMYDLPANPDVVS